MEQIPGWKQAVERLRAEAGQNQHHLWPGGGAAADHLCLHQSGGGEGGGRDQGGALDTPYIYCEGGQDGGLGGHQLVGGGK